MVSNNIPEVMVNSNSRIMLTSATGNKKPSCTSIGSKVIEVKSAPEAHTVEQSCVVTINDEEGDILMAVAAATTTGVTEAQVPASLATDASSLPTDTPCIATAAEYTTMSANKLTTNSENAQSSTSIKSSCSSNGSLQAYSNIAKEIEIRLMEPLLERHTCCVCELVIRYPISFKICHHSCCLTCFMDKVVKLKRCPVENTLLKSNEVSLNEPLRKEIDKLSVFCSFGLQGCKWNGIVLELSDHLNTCEYLPVICPNEGCYDKHERKYMAAHVEGDCVKSKTRCPFCDRVMFKVALADHKELCDMQPIACPMSCGKSDIPEKQVADHLENECPRQLHNCPFHEAGCSFQGLRDTIDLHVVGESEIHLKLAIVKMQTYKLSIETHQKVIDDQSHKISKLTKKLSAIKSSSGLQFIWTIDDFEQQFEDSVSGLVPQIYSPEFQTNKYGYTLVLSSRLNGFREGIGRYMSLQVHLKQGVHDRLLAWPFDHKVTFCVILPGRRTVNNMNLLPHCCQKNIPYLGRPSIEKLNPGFGIDRFAKITDIKQWSAKTDCLCIGVEVIFNS